MPKLFRMTKAGKLNRDIFEGATINTPSMLCVEDWLDALKWAASIGGLPELKAPRRRQPRRAGSLGRRRRRGSTSWPRIRPIRSNTSVCLKVVDPAVTALSADAQADFAKKLASLLEKEGVALDVGGYRDAPPGLRIWCGATVETADLEALTPWLDWAFASRLAELAARLTLLPLMGRREASGGTSTHLRRRSSQTALTRRLPPRRREEAR